jgi:hypothetical protein
MARLGFILKSVSVLVVFLAALACASGDTTARPADAAMPGSGDASASGTGFNDQPTPQPNGTGGNTTSNDDTTPVPVCGNNVKEAGEICDGTDLDGATCSSLEPGSIGTLACSADCLNYDVTACAPSPDTVSEAGVGSDGGPGY